MESLVTLPMTETECIKNRQTNRQTNILLYIYRYVNFFCNSAMVQPVGLIFELDRDINETKLCRKFHLNLILLSKVIVLTAGRTAGHTDRL